MDDIITLKKTGADANNIAFSAAVTTSGAKANKLVTINPSNDLEAGAVYVAVSNGYYDAQGNQGAASNVTFNIDTTAPSFSSAKVDGATLTATFSENLAVETIDPDRFYYRVNQGSPADPSSYTLSGATVTLTLPAAVAVGDTVTLGYSRDGALATEITDVAGNYLAGFVDKPVTNATQAAAVKVSPATLTVAEGSTGTFGVQLATRPSAAVTVSLTVTGDADVTVDTDPNTAGNQTTLSFSTANWGAARTVTVSAAQDADTEDHQATVTLNPAGGDYDAVANATVTVTEDDDDTDTTAPTVTSASSGYFKDANLAAALSGPVSATDDIYVKVTFSETVGQTIGEGAAARPEISYAIDGAATQFDIVAAGTTLLSGDCRPDEATPADVYECRYTAQAGDEGAFDFRVGTETADTDSNKLASAYTHSAKIAIDNTAPTFCGRPCRRAR